MDKLFNSKKLPNKLVIQVDTGMCRSGMQHEDILKIYNERSIIKKFKEVIILTHLASADEKIVNIMSFKKIDF